MRNIMGENDGGTNGCVWFRVFVSNDENYFNSEIL